MTSNIIEQAKKILGIRDLSEAITTTKIKSAGSTPDELEINNTHVNWPDAAGAFLFIGKDDGAMLYLKNKDHYRAIHSMMVGYIRSAYDKADVNDDLDIEKYGVQSSRPIKFSDVTYALRQQDLASINTSSIARRATRAGRLWSGINLTPYAKNRNVASFWCKESEVTESDLKTILKEFNVKSMFWCAMDSDFFNEYGAKVKELGGKNVSVLKSKLFPELKHNDIVNILIKAHTSAGKLSDMESKVVKEFRGTADIEKLYLPNLGGYSTPAEYNYRSRMSEDDEDI